MTARVASSIRCSTRFTLGGNTRAAARRAGLRRDRGVIVTFGSSSGKSLGHHRPGLLSLKACKPYYCPHATAPTLSQDDLGVIVTTSTSPPATSKVPTHVHTLVRSCRNTTLAVRIPT